jgi:RecG-like helicase
MELTKLFSKSQIQNLAQVGYSSLYQLITMTPLGLEVIEPFLGGYVVDPKAKYFWRAVLTNAEKKLTNKAPYWYLTFTSNGRSISCYYFANTSFSHKVLIPNTEFDLILKKNGDFWAIDKLKPASANSLISIRTIQPKYSKNGFIGTAFFEQIHKQIPNQLYILNLQGLVPDNSIVPSIIDLSGIHHPVSFEHFNNTTKSWTAFNVFLKIALIKYLDSKREIKFARNSDLDSDFNQKLLDSLPFKLSNSQKTVINDLLPLICYQK